MWNAQTSGIHFASGGGLARSNGKSSGPPPWQESALAAWSAKQSGPPVEVKSVSRGVPDVAANADFAAGCRLFVGGIETVAGGTSASAPLWAALLARINVTLHAGTGRRVGFANPALYAPAAVATFTSIDAGTNCLGNPAGCYRAVPGVWDPCTGLGTPHGEKLLAALESLYRRSS